MILDEVIKNWCGECHDFSEDEKYLQYARFVVSTPWVKGLKRHLAVLWIAFVLVFAILFAQYPSIHSAPMGMVLLQTFGYLGVMTLSFILYGIKKYNLQDGSTLLCYAMMVMGLGFSYGKLPEVWQAVFGIVMLPVSFGLHYIVPARFRKVKKEMKQFHADKEKEAQNLADLQEKDEFDRWSDQLWGSQSAVAEAVLDVPPQELPCIADEPELLPEPYEEPDYEPYEEPEYEPYEEPVDHTPYEEPEEIPASAEQRPDYLMESARSMFDGIEMTPEALRQRYDELIQTYCVGDKADEQLIECIDEVYNELFEVISQ